MSTSHRFHPSSIRRPLSSPGRLGAALLLTAATSGAGSAATEDSDPWPSFRGAGARGVAEGQDLPLRWNVTSGANIRWSVAVPGQGHSSPVVWGDRIFLTTAVPKQPDSAAGVLRLGDTGGIDMVEADVEYRWLVMGLRVADGGTMWSTVVAEGAPRAPRHVKASQANATPATDGRYVAAILGSEGLFLLRASDGEVLWRRDLGVNDPGLFGDSSSHWGAASSPILWRDRVIVQVDRHADSFVAAYRLADGDELWRIARDEMPVWATPTVVDAAGRPELVVVGGRTVRGLDPETGRELWRFADFAEVKTPTAFQAGDLLILSGGYRGRPLYALEVGGAGDLTVPADEEPRGHLAWRTGRGGPYTSTPVAYRGLLFSVRNTGILAVYDLETGERLARRRLDDTYSASPVASDGRVFLAGENGSVTVVSATAEPEILSVVEMGEPLLASPAIAEGTLYLRTTGHLYAVAAEAGSADAPSPTVAAAGEGRRLLQAALDALEPLGSLRLEGSGDQDLAIRYQGVRPVPGGGRKPYRESFVLDATNDRLGWESHAQRPDGTPESLRFVYGGDGEMQFFHLADGFGAWVRDPDAGATRRALERRLPHRILAAALAEGAEVGAVAWRTLPDGSRARRVGVRLADGRALELYVGADDAGAPVLVAIEQELEIPLRGLETVTWTFQDYRRVEGVGPFPGAYRLWLGDQPYRRVTFETISAAAADAPVFQRPSDIALPEEPHVVAAAEESNVDWPAPRTRELAPGVWLVGDLRGGFHSLAVDLGEELVLVDAPTGWWMLDRVPAENVVPEGVDGAARRAVSARLLATARELAPGKPVGGVVLSHFHGDHAGGYGVFAAEGIPLLGTEEAVAVIQRAAAEELPAGVTLRTETVEDRRVLAGSERSVELLEIHDNPHAQGLLAVHLPESGLLWIADLFRVQGPERRPPPSEQHLADAFVAWLGEHDLEVSAIGSPHMFGTLTGDALQRVLQRGTP